MEYIVPPDSYINLIGTVALLVSILCLFITFWEKQRSQATKLFSIMLVASLSFFSSHWATYFAAIFIVATAVTELEFLQNLAAIIRKDENYFKYKKEALSKAENIRRKAEETIEEEYTSKQPVETEESTVEKIDLSKLRELSNISRMKLSFEIEEKALIYLSKEYGNIERGVRFKKGNESVEFDGVSTNGRDKEDIIFEVKWARYPDHAHVFIINSLRRSSEQVSSYSSITGKKPIFNLVVVTNTKTSIGIDRWDNLRERAKRVGINLINLSLKEIGFEVTNEIA
ncbi:hypothetical protein SAMN02745753_02215 [Marinomonas polaris DSM 16579]|uniref:Uncharacterized protein n=1 Tax=Marinomonas polaris DSM 16579 TaxID=1122206 RepID=A0A1M5CRP5_9GAMM|nr:hypothetical protein [Marinomonas polaris]SHF56992.1 hypothetical protein SAMN02745753_02215 [Marinomonas polaris DSM 16579]